LARGNGWAVKAPILVALCARESDDYTREDDPVRYYQFDSGMACLSLLLGAEQLGLMGHAMAGYDANAVKEALSIPEEYHVICVISLGYEGTLDMLDEETRSKDESERTRKPHKEIISFDKFDF
ncbi:MAG: nitroreductase family protein, partial [bacterium]|nr:nitroreductase family protein [bacterium]